MSSEATSGWRTRQLPGKRQVLSVSSPNGAAPPAAALPAVFLQRAGSPITPTFLLTNSDSRRKLSVICISVKSLRT